MKDVKSILRLRPPSSIEGKPFIKWVGGKGQLIPAIARILPHDIHDSEELTYVEPFVGGGAMLFWALNNIACITKAVINDINPDLVTAYRTVRDNPQDLIATLKDIQKEYLALGTEEQRKDFYLARREHYNCKSLEPIENTALFIFLNKTCFNGLYRVNSKGLYNVPFGKYANPAICDETTLTADSRLLQKVEIVHGDFSQTERYADEHALFYLDPPYKPLSVTSSFNSYAKEEFGDAEQIRLKHFCDKLNDHGSYWVLSNSDMKANGSMNDFFDDLYAEYHIERIWASRAVNSNAEKRGKLTELLITNGSGISNKKVVNY